MPAVYEYMIFGPRNYSLDKETTEQRADAALRQLGLEGLKQTKRNASHDLDMLPDTCGRVLLLSHGRLAAEGNTEAILCDRALLQANRMDLPLCLQGRPLHLC